VSRVEEDEDEEAWAAAGGASEGLPVRTERSRGTLSCTSQKDLVTRVRSERQR
jgi:hypothetical protein